MVRMVAMVRMVMARMVRMVRMVMVRMLIQMMTKIITLTMKMKIVLIFTMTNPMSSAVVSDHEEFYNYFTKS